MSVYCVYIIICNIRDIRRPCRHLESGSDFDRVGNCPVSVFELPLGFRSVRQNPSNRGAAIGTLFSTTHAGFCQKMLHKGNVFTPFEHQKLLQCVSKC